MPNAGSTTGLEDFMNDISPMATPVGAKHREGVLPQSSERKDSQLDCFDRSSLKRRILP
jgi:hypothetical protein